MVLNEFPYDSQHFMFSMSEDFAADIINHMISCRTGGGEITGYWGENRPKSDIKLIYSVY